MSTPYTIAINGAAAVSSQSLGLSFGGLELANMAHDSAALKWTRRRASEACPLAHNDTVEIYRGTTRLFHGRARLGTVTNEGVNLRVLGPWSHLEEQIYHLSLSTASFGDPDGFVLGDTYVFTCPPYSLDVSQSSPHNVTFTVTTRSRYTGWPATTGESDVNMGWTSRFWLFRPGGTSGQIYTTIQEEFSRLMTFVETTNAASLFTLGTLSLGNLVAPRVRTITDTLVSDAVRQVMAMKPDAALWWQYSGSGVPVLRAGVASVETPLELTIGRRDGQALSNYQLKLADELIPTGVVVRWERDGSTSTGLGAPFLADFYPGSEVVTNCDTTNGSTNVDCDSTADLEAGMQITGAGVPSYALISSITNATRFVLSVAATSTLSVQRMVARKSTGPASYEPGVLLHSVTDEMTVVPGLAKEVYQSLQTRRAQGSLTVLDTDFSLGLRPGRVITLTGDPQLTDVQLWVQSVSWSAETGLAQLTVGYPAHLNLRDRVDLRGWFRWTFQGVFSTYSWLVPPP
jgi:hypothetical protein